MYLLGGADRSATHSHSQPIHSRLYQVVGLPVSYGGIHDTVDVGIIYLCYHHIIDAINTTIDVLYLEVTTLPPITCT